jgi:phosphate transport system protein
MRHFEELLEELLQKVVVMGTIVEGMVRTAMQVLMEHNEAHTARLMAKEQEVNQLQVDIDNAAVTLAVTQQPVAQDARFVFMASRISSELERIGDQCVNISQNARWIIKSPPLKPLVDIPIMADVVQKMVRDSVTAMISRDPAVADTIRDEEEKVDAFRDQIFRTLLTYMMADPSTIQRAMSLILVARNLERIGDHATNIAEEVIYWVQGRDVRRGGSHLATAPANGNTPQGTPLK